MWSFRRSWRRAASQPSNPTAGKAAAARMRPPSPSALQLVEAVLGAGQKEGDRSPERGKRTEAAGADQAPPAEYRLGAGDVAGLAELAAIAACYLRRQIR